MTISLVVPACHTINRTILQIQVLERKQESEILGTKVH